MAKSFAHLLITISTNHSSSTRDGQNKSLDYIFPTKYGIPKTLKG